MVILASSAAAVFNFTVEKLLVSGLPALGDGGQGQGDVSVTTLRLWVWDPRPFRTCQAPGTFHQHFLCHQSSNVPPWCLGSLPSLYFHHPSIITGSPLHCLSLYLVTYVLTTAEAAATTKAMAPIYCFCGCLFLSGLPSQSTHDKYHKISRRDH